MEKQRSLLGTAPAVPGRHQPNVYEDAGGDSGDVMLTMMIFLKIAEFLKIPFLVQSQIS